MVRKKFSSPFLEAAHKKQVRLCAAFGGQAPDNGTCLESIRRLRAHGDAAVSTLLKLANTTLADLGDEEHPSRFHDSHGFALEAWLDNADVAPDSDYIALAPVSFPLITLISLIEYTLTCRALGVHPGQLRELLTNVTGHSQGMFAAAAVAVARDWPSFFDACEAVLCLSFWVGLESHHAAPKSKIPAVSASDCIAHGEGQPSYMLSVTGLPRPQLEAVIRRVNSNNTDGGDIHLALINSSKHRFAIAGQPSALRTMCMHLRQIKAPEGIDQRRLPFHKRKPMVQVQFMPISAPFHTKFLECVDQLVLQRLDGVIALGSAEILLLNPSNGHHITDLASPAELSQLIRSVTVDRVDWAATCLALPVSHLLAFGPGRSASLINETTDGIGLQVVQVTDLLPALKDSDNNGDIFANLRCSPLQSWQQEFAPEVVIDQHECKNLVTRMSLLLGAPPIMVAGMTPTTVHPEFCAAIMDAGYHVELAGGGYASESKFEAALRELSARAPERRGITCNVLYISPKTIAWQISTIRRLIREGVRIDGITIGAGIPSPEVIKEYIETVGLKHISFKPGTEEAIREVVEIARQNPTFNFGLQWTGGRAGGHHSLEDFHDPILKTYSLIRSCENIVLIAGSGLGEASEISPYFTGEWASEFGRPAMPFDGVLLGSRVMIAREAKTSAAAKRLIVDAEGVEDANWHKAADANTGGVITITSEMGQPIHMLATRGVMLWKELDETVFSIKDVKKRLDYLQSHRGRIISRLNQDFQKPWFAIDATGRTVEINDLTYAETVARFCKLTYVEHQNRWIDPSYHSLAKEVVHMAAERFGQVIDTTHCDHPGDLLLSLEAELNESANETLYPVDARKLLALFRRRGQKPVPFVPKLDENFETWFKKDSLWQAEDIDAVLDQDIQRVCIIHGPVAARHSKKDSESVKDILDEIYRPLIEDLSDTERLAPLVDSQSDDAVHIALPPKAVSEVPGLKISTTGQKTTYELLKTGKLPEPSAMLQLLSESVGVEWFAACLLDETVVRGSAASPNPIRQALQLQAGDIVEVIRCAQSKAIASVSFLSPSGVPKRLHRALTVEALGQGRLGVSVSLDAETAMRIPFEYRAGVPGTRLSLVSDWYLRTVQDMYAELWGDGSGMQTTAGIGSEFSCKAVTVQHEEVQKYVRVIQQSCPPQLLDWQPGHSSSVPLDYCIVVAWTALTKPLLLTELSCDLLKLVHQSVNFRYVDGASPIEVGDVLQTTSRITKLGSRSNGSQVEISATIHRSNEAIVDLTCEFFIQGKATEHAKQFTSIREADMVVDIHSPVIAALITSRKWLIRQHPGTSSSLIGRRLVFQLTTHTTSPCSTATSGSLQAHGLISLCNGDGSLEPFGRVYFECEDNSFNPVKDFLQRYGTLKDERNDLENPGWEGGPSTLVMRAPLRSASYSSVSRDGNPIHTSPFLARFAGLPGTIVHGMHLSAMVRRATEWLIGDHEQSRFHSWTASFEAMVRPGDMLRTEFQHVAMENGKMVLEVNVYNNVTGERVMKSTAVVEQARTAYIFCGQGSQEKRMGMSLYESSPAARALFNRGEAYLREHYGFSILKIIRENPTGLTISFGGRRGRRIRQNYLTMGQRGTSSTPYRCIVPSLTAQSASYTFHYPKGLLYSTQFSQPALALMEMAQYEHLRSQGILQQTSLFAGHSLGEYAALGSCSTVLPFERLMTLVFYRGLKMQNALQRDIEGKTDYSMVAVDPSRISKDFSEATFRYLVEAIATQSGLLLEVVNFNIQDKQYVCAGHFRTLYILSKICDELSIIRDAAKFVTDSAKFSALVRNHIEASSILTNSSVLERGKATIPLSGVDLPFHSTMLRGHIGDYREYLDHVLKVSDIKVEELVGRWVPNVIGKPFAVSRDYVEEVAKITNSERLGHLVSVMA
ncbi:putative sterigmatocystin biosynthesis fatty acid synthase subunit beta [Cercospora beticola]|uniref:Putative sterigmatocystin biosynthesis fatty acid synthase subunit beta n=1 Tax=Cercospora beticola TaxID=122368 RepID=A0A2G5I520_CERBT|nr:putative sterigmatocystin biosynthesis fatty acid synthase subunit beta [Cercospora beticola]PIA99573.1 putative sterigmatocystin biosynthesis fatty acid synthase subunit beta [Cercospora beticola]WPB00155.1 hypothetical protein RHO25_004774 [Cercospora beticola]CAK1361657.1 unnamed protein product [Cercospora beticola]